MAGHLLANAILMISVCGIISEDLVKERCLARVVCNGNPRFAAFAISPRCTDNLYQTSNKVKTMGDRRGMVRKQSGVRG